MCMNMNTPYASTFGIFKNYHALYVLLMFIELANYDRNSPHSVQTFQLAPCTNAL